MILEEDDLDQHQLVFKIRPNRSMSTRGMWLFVLLVSLAVLLLAFRFYLLGAWVVVPFAFLEVFMLALGFWLFDRSSRYRETLQLSREWVLVTQGGLSGKKEWRFNPHWVKVNLKLDSKEWYPSRLIIAAHGEQIEIGACLTNQEREKLSEAINVAMPKILNGVA